MAHIFERIANNLGIERHASKTMAFGQFSDRGKPQSYSDRDLERFDSIHGYVNGCIRAIADQIASTPINLYNDGEKVDDHIALSLLDDPADHIDGYTFKEAIVKHLLLAGDSYIETVTTRQKFGEDRYGERPVQLIPITPPSSVTIVPTGKKDKGLDLIKGYLFTTYKGNDMALEKDEVIHTKLFKSDDSFYGLSPLEPLKEELVTDIEAIDYNKNFFHNSARPDGILNTEQQLTDDAHDTLKERWLDAHRGTSNAHKVAVLGRAIQYQSIGLSQEDMQFIEQRQMTKNDIRGIYGVPKTYLGDTSATYASSNQATENFYLNVIMPLARRIAKSLTRHLLKPYWRDKLEFKFNFIGSEALIPLIQEKAQLHLQLIKTGWPLNMASTLIWGEKFFDDELGQMAFLPSNLVPAGATPTSVKDLGDVNKDISVSSLINHDKDVEVDPDAVEKITERFLKVAENKPDFDVENIIEHLPSDVDKSQLQDEE
ncbi:MAG: phage portal protein [Clostridiales bacterium]|nr:phage portal protein [Clostridiales bacterium]